jgi:hypothetical protein
MPWRRWPRVLGLRKWTGLVCLSDKKFEIRMGCNLPVRARLNLKVDCLKSQGFAKSEVVSRPQLLSTGKPLNL